MNIIFDIPKQLAISIMLIASVAFAAGAGFVTNVVCVADTTLQIDFPDNNTGGADSFTAGGRNNGGPTRALLRFDVAEAIPPGATINSAVLTITVNAVNGPDSTFALHRVVAGWGEGEGEDFRGGSPGGEADATWNVRLGPGTPWTTAGGDFVPSSSAIQFVSASASYEFTSAALATDVQLWLGNPGTNFGWILLSQSENTSGTIRRFAGRLDAASPPLLAVDYSLSAVPASQPVITNLARAGNQIRFSFDAESNRTYTVESRDLLAAGNWNALTNLPPQPASTTFHITNTVNSTEQYFRVTTP